MPLWKVSKLLGHRDISITLRVYGHLTPEGRENVARRMEEVLGPRVEETAVRILDESLGGGDFEIEIAPSGTAWKNVSQISCRGARTDSAGRV